MNELETAFKADRADKIAKQQVASLSDITNRTFNASGGTFAEKFMRTLARYIRITPTLFTISSPTSIRGWLNVDGATIFSGLGTPEGNVAAYIGSIYLRRDGGSGTTLYVKETGNGLATGWSSTS